LASPAKGPDKSLQVTAVAQEERFLVAMKVAFAHRSFQLLTAGFFVCGFHLAFITVHMPPYLADMGADPGLAAWAISMIGLFNIVGAYGSGVLGGRMSKRWLLSGIYFSRALAIAAFMVVPLSSWSVLIFAAVMGALWLSTVPLTSGLIAVMFGTRHIGMLFGLVFFSHQVGAFIGVWLGGELYARTHSYDAMWWAGVVLGIFSAVVHLPIKERPARPPAAEASRA
jgi:MFS family permease